VGEDCQLLSDTLSNGMVEPRHHNQRLEAARQYRDIVNDMAKEQIDSRANAVVRAVKDQAAARAFLRNVMTQDHIRYQRQKDAELDQRRVEQGHEDIHCKRWV
jgi:hypothetical protein